MAALANNKFVSTVTVEFDIMSNSASNLKCGSCHNSFENSGKAVKALNQYWHKGCLKCVSCKLAINGNHIAKGKGAECEECVSGKDNVFDNFEEFLGDDLHKPVVKVKYPKCAKCKKDIKENEQGCTSQDGKQYHVKCFVCDECGGSIAGKPFGMDEKGNKVCQECMAKYQ